MHKIKVSAPNGHDKYSVSNKELRTYHHYFYQVDTAIDGEYFSLEELLNDDKIKKI